MREPISNHPRATACWRKRGYTKRELQTWLNRYKTHKRRYRSEGELRAYKCPHCEFYHLTKMPDWEEPEETNGG